MFDFLDGPVRELVTQIYEAVGYLGVALWVAIESVVIPIPSELVLPFAGFLAADPSSIEPLTGAPWSLPLLVVFATIGSLAGALLAYAIGYWGGRSVLLRWGRVLRISPQDIERTEAFFERWGALAAVLGRMVPVVRSLVSFGAGIGRMPLPKFALYTVLGSIPWNVGLVGGGYLLGDNWDAAQSVLSRFEYAVIGGLLLVLVGWVWLRYVRPRRGTDPAA